MSRLHMYGRREAEGGEVAEIDSYYMWRQDSVTTKKINMPVYTVAVCVGGAVILSSN